MLNMETLKASLLEIYGIPEKYLVPLCEGWFVPTTDPEDKTGSWIGYKISEIVPYARAYADGRIFTKPVRIKFRLAFIGRQAEELAYATEVWEDRSDTVAVFEKYRAQLNYNQRRLWTYPVKNQGFNDALCWIVDMQAQSFLEIDTHWKPWFARLQGVDDGQE